MKRLAIAVLGVLALSACGKHEKPNTVYMPDMAYSPAFKAQEEGGMRVPVKGTVSRNHVSYRFPTDPEGAGRELRNPLRRSKETLARGQKMFNTYCIVCHGAGGAGDGTIVPKFPRPPSLTSEKVVGWPDGRLFHVMTAGQNLMPSYASQVDEEDRWAIAHYVRVLQRAANPTPDDLKAYDAWSK